jgi:hypothetical protein
MLSRILRASFGTSGSCAPLLQTTFQKRSCLSGPVLVIPEAPDMSSSATQELQPPIRSQTQSAHHGKQIANLLPTGFVRLEPAVIRPSFQHHLLIL